MDMGKSENETILLVDDEFSLREVMGYMLSQEGYRVLEAETGEEAIEIYQRKADLISLVVLDLMLPDMYGTDCLQSLLERNPRAKVIVCSGNAGETETQEALDRGAKICLEKPVSMDALASAIRAAIQE